MKTAVYSAAILLAIGMFANAQSRTYIQRRVVVPVVPAGAYYGYPYNPYNYNYTPGYSSSTVAEGYGHGMADVIRSQGDYNLSSSEAAKNMTEARQKEIENQKQWTQTYFDMRAVNRQAKEQEAAQHRGTPEEWARYAQAGKPKLLSSKELDSVTGEIHWPVLLTADTYEAERTELEKAFAERAYQGVLSSDSFLNIRRLTESMLNSLKEQIRDVPASQYMTAKRFLESLAYEASQPAG
jgi:hypothetical protein